MNRTAACVPYLERDGTGLLRRGEDEFVVAGLKIEYVRGTGTTPTRKVAELRLFRSGEWCTKRSLICHYDGGQVGELVSSWQNSIVVPVGDQLLSWVDQRRGLLLSKVFDESPGLRYVPLPVDSRMLRPSFRNVCATAGGGTVKFVNIFPRCCCGSAGLTVLLY
ncbi:hypothetical protein BAE44_0002525 [Dichanthelium oligosanthes]|uniref:DUF1618 domain-containing protein n=1 Tax=Dichanthelium oligosanthes TaxID=888268 RepID=A0A1E5WGD3_9POAL|nr:hypothetical protein BAE44_0002525 [Dichanthelium oligosanthes]